MRKSLLLVFAACIVLSSCGAFKKIEINTNSKGVRTVLTSCRHVFSNVKVALGARSVNAKDTVMVVYLYSTKDSEHGLFDSGDVFQIKLTDNTIINLKNILDKEYEKETVTSTSTVSRPYPTYGYCYGPFGEPYFISAYDMYSMIPVTTTTTTTYSSAMYLVTAQQMIDILTKGIVKARIECEEGYLDVPNPARLQEVFKNELEDLVDTFFKDPKASADEF